MYYKYTFIHRSHKSARWTGFTSARLWRNRIDAPFYTMRLVWLQTGLLFWPITRVLFAQLKLEGTLVFVPEKGQELLRCRCLILLRKRPIGSKRWLNYFATEKEIAKPSSLILFQNSQGIVRWRWLVLIAKRQQVILVWIKWPRNSKVHINYFELFSSSGPLIFQVNGQDIVVHLFCYRKAKNCWLLILLPVMETQKIDD